MCITKCIYNLIIYTTYNIYVYIYRKTLAEEIVKMTSTAQKRKLKLKERSQKKKLKKSGSISNSNEVYYIIVL